jgi:uncharacterized membrane protein YjfL (UPF0719 family)
MDDLGGDEQFFLIASAIVGLILFCIYLLAVLRREGPRGTAGVQLGFLLTPVAIFAFLLFVLQTWADAQTVRGNTTYIVLFLAGGLLWFGVAAAILRFLGLSIADDAIERGNRSAAVAIAGALLGSGAVYALSNVGEGPTIWTTMLPALIGTIAWFILFLTVHAIGNAIEAITLDRDVATGIRFAALLICLGVILGRAMAGDFDSWNQTFFDFLFQGWPAVVLAIAGGCIDRRLRPTPNSPHQPVLIFGLFPALGYLIVTAAVLLLLGPWHANELMK